MNANVDTFIERILSIKKNHVILISIALILSISIISAQRFFNTTLSNELQYSSASLLTADLEIASTKPIPKDKLNRIKNTTHI